MNKFLMIVVLGVLLVSSVSAYYCIYENDDIEVKQFKNNLNLLSIKSDLDRGVSPEGIMTKIKIFNPCK